MSKIYGDTVGGGGVNLKKIPQSDWNQTDETQCDYIKNKPLEKGLSENSMQQKTCTAGCKGFYWTDIDVTNRKITLAEARKDQISHTLNGVWKFNESIYFDITTRVEVSAKLFGYDITFIQVDEITQDITVDFSTLYDVDIKSQPIDFGAEPQVVSEEFYNWFTSNAIPAVPTVSGVWKFNEMLDMPMNTHFSADIDFINNNTSFNSIIVHPEFESSELAYWIDTEGEDVNYTTVYYEGFWNDETYRTIDFGTEPQEVSEEFYTWFTANAKYIPFDIADYWAVDDVISIHSDKKWINCSTITAIDGNIIIVDAFPTEFAVVEEDTHITDQAVYILAKPDKGIADVGQNSIVFGSYNEINPAARFQIGNGTSDTNRKNAFEVLSDGIVVNGVTLTSTQLQKILDFIDTIE